ncbi:hypothetical protein ACJ73_00132 [Blastomyces percursus]|uniref:Uncharacterized protein n=1 Tax=Blastomyces percursus TaxID=1658174 RepID=A0A1J9RIW7_9EURO|nr:hypothetical protein ACJ73_00132 [Blastomyces percursus]
MADQIEALRLTGQSEGTSLNRGVDENVRVFPLWTRPEDEESYLPAPAKVALALNEVGRALGMGICTYILASVPFMPFCIPEVYFTAYKWTEKDKRNWDRASFQRKLSLVSQVRPEDHAIPIRLLAYGCPQDVLSFEKEGARLSGAIITYDNRMFVGWYREYASRRNSDRMRISVNLLQHYAWFNSMHCQDNFAVVQRLLRMWDQPVYYGVQVIGNVLGKLDDLKQRYMEAESNALALESKRERDVPDYEIDHLDLRLLAGNALNDYDAEDADDCS